MARVFNSLFQRLTTSESTLTGVVHYAWDLIQRSMRCFQKPLIHLITFFIAYEASIENKN